MESNQQLQQEIDRLSSALQSVTRERDDFNAWCYTTIGTDNPEGIKAILVRAMQDRRDRDGLAALAEELKGAIKDLLDIMEGAHEDDPSGYRRLGFDNFTTQPIQAALSLTPETALQRKEGGR